MIIPSIDLSKGKAVQLRQGKEKVLENSQVCGLAEKFSRFGPVAVVDLDAAMGKGDNLNKIKEICRFAEARVGGGIRDVKRAVQLVDWGADKVIIGTRALDGGSVNHSFLNELASAVGKERVIIALDTFQGKIVTQGWQHQTEWDGEAVVEEFQPYASEILFTCVEKEGMMKGPDFRAVQNIQERTSLPLTVAGGISSLREIETLSRFGVNVQFGMALYKGEITLPQAFAASLDWKKGLIPTVTQDTFGQVLMLAYSSRKSLMKTFETGKAWYYSRSREKLWMKGETSGNIQRFQQIRADCDLDTLLLTVYQKGKACHTGRYSCFGNKRFSLGELYQVVKDRLDHPSPDSYTSQLTPQMMKEKIEEEAAELKEAQEKEDVIWETADLIYFTLVWMSANHVSLQEVEQELRRRRQKKR
ncbi:bifunctional phosphoribosyl-AMP cyclohydrolase/phosphoribosyl-ATP diphosphatase HisIE [bacterium]|nr:bifunctional phosphoribosyl-AMP cyclohydrolase/phosphoribosyl-ATP diphosphatase HisIE [bacterium]